MDSRQRWAVLIGGLAGAMSAWGQPQIELELPSCVAGSPPLRVPVASERAELDAADRRRFDDAAQARYPIYQRGGMASARVLILRRHGQWQYLSLAPGGPAGPCVSAVFAADRFDFTPAWLGKYRPRAAVLGD